MGAAGFGFQLEQRAGSADDQKLRGAFVATLAGAFVDLLGVQRAWARMASTWLSDPFDSLLKIEVSRGAVTLWFNDSVQWPGALAEHWVRVALAMRRNSFAVSLAKVGCALPADWPKVDEACWSAPRFFSYQDRIGRIDAQAELVSWEVGDLGNDAEVGSSAFSDLAPEARALMNQALSSRRCLCPLCVAVFPPGVVDAFQPFDGFEIRLERIVGAASIERVVQLPAGWLVATRTSNGGLLSLLGARLHEAGTTLPELSNTPRSLDQVAVLEERVVAQLGVESSGARFVAHSLDGGRCFSPPVPHPNLPKLKSARFFTGSSPGVVYASGSPVKALYRSSNAGASFELAAEAPTLDGKPFRGIVALVETAGRLVAVLYGSRRAYYLATSQDGGATFHASQLPAPAEPRDLVVWPDEPHTIGCLTAEYNRQSHNTRNAAFLRSGDWGSSWSVHPIASRSSLHFAAGPAALITSLSVSDSGVHASRDRGRSWQVCSTTTADACFADPTGETLGLVAKGPALYSVRPK